ncbi:MAG: FMN-binding negative transcriptional regulator [Candidatus Rokubacteria bacterium]|nr:FMN-binding negative transcriptional regulator [Candidatus Rokubacteria bacterium]
MIFHEVYSGIDRAEIDRFVASQEMGRLVTVCDDGTPHVGLYPFVHDGDTVELHLVREDEQVTDLRARPRCVFELDEILGTIPSYWVHAQYGGAATAYHRTVILECRGEVIHDADVLAAQQQRLLARYQPEGGHRPVAADDPVYRGRLALLVGVRLTVVRCRPKFKLGQNRPEAARRAIITELRRRGRPNDARAADALEWTLGRPTEVMGGL